MRDIPSDEETGLQYTVTTGPRHRSHFQARILPDS
jgi:hypothetical protein